MPGCHVKNTLLLSVVICQLACRLAGRIRLQVAEQASEQVDLPPVHRCPEWTVGLSDESKTVCERWQTGASAYDAGSPAQRAHRGETDWPVARCALTWALAKESRAQGSTPSEASSKQAGPPWGIRRGAGVLLSC